MRCDVQAHTHTTRCRLAFIAFPYRCTTELTVTTPYGTYGCADEDSGFEMESIVLQEIHSFLNPGDLQWHPSLMNSL